MLTCVLVTLALAYVGWATFPAAHGMKCYACKRPIHAHSKTVAFADGRSRLFCCPACALSQHQQMGKPIKITQVTSFLTGKAIFRPIAPMLFRAATSTCARQSTNLWTPISGPPICVMIDARQASSRSPNGMKPLQFRPRARGGKVNRSAD